MITRLDLYRAAALIGAAMRGDDDPITTAETWAQAMEALSDPAYVVKQLETKAQVKTTQQHDEQQGLLITHAYIESLPPGRHLLRNHRHKTRTHEGAFLG